MKIFNKFIWSKKEPSNKNDIWFDGSTWKMYTEEAWQSFTLPVDAADKLAKVLEDVSKVYQEKLNAGYGIVIDGNTISVDESIKYDDTELKQQLTELSQEIILNYNNNLNQSGQINTLFETKADKVQFEGKSYVETDGISTNDFYYSMPDSADGTEDDIIATKSNLKKINGQDLYGKGNIVIEGKNYDNEIATLKQKDAQTEAKLTELSEKVGDREPNGGMGYVILSKDKTFAEQVTKANTIYEIRYDFDLGGARLNLPKNSTLKFLGGKLANGTILGSNSTISATASHIVDNCTLEGTWNNLTASLAWWGATEGAEFDNSPIIKKAMDSAFPIIEVAGAYYMSSPVELAYNKVIKGRAAHHNELTGFYASDNFAPVQVNFPSRGGKEAFSQVVKGMFYHRDAAKSEMHDVFINARHKADYCIEHIDLYGSTDLYNCYIVGANGVGILQYASENPVYDRVYIKDCNIGMYISTQKYKGGNPLNPSFLSGETMGMPNIVTGNNILILNCNYGFIVNGSYDFRVSNLATAYNAIIGTIIANTAGEINKYYSEGDGRCNFFINSQGVKEDSENGKSLAYLVDKNLDGISAATTIGMGKSTFIRGVLYNYKSRIEITSAYVSYYARSYNHNIAGYVLMDKRDAQGVDCCFINNEGIFNVDVLRLYNHPNDVVGDNLYSAIITLSNYGNDKNNVGCCDAKGVNSIIAPIQALYFNATEKQMYNQQHSVQKYNPSDYNYNIEAARRNYGQDNERTCKYYGQYKNRPLYFYGEGNRKAIWFTKEELSSFFPNKKIVQVYMVVRVLNKASLAPNIAVTYFNEANAALYFYSNNVLGATTLDKGIYEFVQYVPIETTFDYHHVSINSNLDNNQNYVVSHLYFYDVEDAICLPHNFTSVVLDRGTKRPTISYEGQEFYDLNLHKVIYANSTLDGWVDTTGASV